MGNRLKDALAKYAENFALDKGFMVLDNGYFYDFRQNIFNQKMDQKFEKMFLDGDGNELASKACAVHSSSMLGYNFFHWINNEHKLTIQFSETEKIAYNKVSFEVKIPVLKCRGSRSANMDIVLRNDDGDWLFIESKFLEYLNTGSFKMSESYYKPDSYYAKGAEWSNFISNRNFISNKQYWDGIKQEICHIIGLTNWIYGEIVIDGENYNKLKDVRFINLVFEPNNNQFEKDHECFENYKTIYNELHNQLEDAQMFPIDERKIGFMTYSDLWENIQGSISEDLQKYLQDHYMDFAQ